MLNEIFEGVLPGRPATLLHSFEKYVRNHKLIVAFAATLLDVGTYLLANHFPRIEPRFIPLLLVDRSVPFVPASIWVYASDWLLVFVAFLAIRSARDSGRFAVAFIALVLFGAAVHWLFPVAYPREVFPVPEQTWRVNVLAFAALRWLDSPSSCIPSMHVACSSFAALAVLDSRRAAGTAFAVWAFFVALATLTAKQHYVVDVLAGFAVAGAWYGLFYRGRGLPRR